jgi:hypothetical protein
MINPGEEDDFEELENLTDGGDEEDEGGQGSGEEGGQEVSQDEDTGGEIDEEQGVHGQDRVDSEPPSRQRRSQSRWQARERELAEARQRADEAEQRASALAAEQQRSQAHAQQAAQQDRQRRRELMTPEERISDEVQELRGQISFQAQMDAFYRNDAEDRANYQARATVDKTYKKYQSQVETELKRTRNLGWNIPREEILANIVGKDVLKVAGKTRAPGPAHRRAVSKPVNSRGDGTSTPGRRGPSLERAALAKRLENIPL